MAWLSAEEIREAPEIARTAIIYYLVGVLHLEFEEARLRLDEAVNAIVTIKELKLQKWV